MIQYDNLMDRLDLQNSNEHSTLMVFLLIISESTIPALFHAYFFDSNVSYFSHITPRKKSKQSKKKTTQT